ncbi:MAG TPA: hypothetical protein DIT13_16550, partial [Verrucomicrobiales bacterium]|nr:hypothetical protein [Verrucomicrobiales bacterium]
SSDLQTARCQHTLARRHPEILLSEAGHKVETAGRGMNHLAARLLERIQQRLDSRRDLLRQLGPHAVLARGFSYTTDSSGRVLKNAADAGDGELIRTLLAEGCIESVVRKK